MVPKTKKSTGQVASKSDTLAENDVAASDDKPRAAKKVQPTAEPATPEKVAKYAGHGGTYTAIGGGIRVPASTK